MSWLLVVEQMKKQSGAWSSGRVRSMAMAPRDLRLLKVVPATDPLEVANIVVEFVIKEILLGFLLRVFDGLPGRRRLGQRGRGLLQARLMLTPVVVAGPGNVRRSMRRAGLLALPDLAVVHGRGAEALGAALAPAARSTARLGLGLRLRLLLLLLLLPSAERRESGKSIRLLLSWRGGGGGRRSGVLLRATEVAQDGPFVQDGGRALLGEFWVALLIRLVLLDQPPKRAYATAVGISLDKHLARSHAATIIFDNGVELRRGRIVHATVQLE